jgi:5-methylcytosine-specific restriction endonuclease McrA
MVLHAARVAPERTDFSARLAVVPFLRSDQERSMGKTYGEKLKDPRWQRMRLEVLSRTDFKCALCGMGDKTLHVHHRYYVSGRQPWDYPAHSLVSLCEGCHSAEPEYGADAVDMPFRLCSVIEADGGEPSALLDDLTYHFGGRLEPGERIHWRAFVKALDVAGRFAEATVSGVDPDALQAAFEEMLRDRFGVTRDRMAYKVSRGLPHSDSTRCEDSNG